MKVAKERTTKRGIQRLGDLSGKKFNRWTVTGICEVLETPGGQRKTHWMCICDCGTIKSVYQNSLTSGKSMSCGCAKTRLGYDEAMYNEIYSVYKSKCVRQEKTFDVTKEEFFRLITQDCHYCGKEPSNSASRSSRAKRQGVFKYNGIDRVDNDKGYISSNIVTACKNCNLGKRSLSEGEFLEMVKMIYERHFK